MSNVPVIGLDMFHYTHVLTDSASAPTTYDDAVHVPNVTAANINFNGEVATFFADNGPAVVYSQIGEVEVEISIADLPPEDYAFLIGANYEDGLVDLDTSASAPDVAIGFRAQKANGAYRYMYLYKGKFSVPNAEHETKADTVNFQPQTITFKGVQRASDSKVFRRIDSDDTNLPSGVTATTLLTDFFADPDYTPVVIP
ncbi:phage major tail protein, phi13 family [Anaerovirgula multivorans]|uniref:Phage major tail protein, phi13 family n=1 Tax=Anaerovirgula multivorans TaxID=312168 RepID=A0A239AJE2_9FIRM|nr:major tail protein [Anaerovirgula multivorans]SNR95462.1 phage major tail protein, phi13 family [Anaerovirgula multivorans]